MKAAILIFSTIDLHIEPTKLLEVGLFNAKYHLKRRFHEKCISADWGSDGKIKEIMAANNNKMIIKKIFKKKISN